MSTQLVTVLPSQPVKEALALFDQHHVHHLPVVEADRTLLGIFSVTDVARLLGRETDELDNLTVADVMSRGLAKLESNDNVATAASLFMLNRFHSLPVVDGKRIIGILTTLDLIKLIDREDVELSDYDSKDS